MELNDNNVNISKIKSIIRDFELERGWDKFRNPKDLSMSIAIEAAGNFSVGHNRRGFEYKRKQ